MQSYHKLWLHFVWGTKNRERLITRSLKAKLIPHIIAYGTEKGMHIDSVNGDMDHIHILASVKPIQNPADLANLLKGESSNWINQHDFIQSKFAWQNGYGVFSVSESQVGTVRKYIQNQEEHHRRKTFREEWEGFMEIYGLETP